MFIKLVITFAAVTLPLAAQSIHYPPAPRGDVVDDYNGVKVADPYRWLEDLDSPETRAWVKAEEQLTDSYLAKIPARDALKRRLTELLDYEKFGVPFRRGDRYFYSHNTGLQPQSVLFSTMGLTGEPSVVFDPNLISTNGEVSVSGYDLSPDGSILAYGLTHGGSDWVDWHFRNVATGKDLPDVLHWTKYYGPSFTPDGKGAYYSAFPPPPPGQELRARDLGNAVYYHAFGASAVPDRLVFARAKRSDWQFSPRVSHDGRWLVIAAGEGEVGDKGREDVYLLDLKSTGATVTPLIEGFEAAYVFVGADNGLLLFQTTLNAPRGRVVAIDPASPQCANWRQVVPEGPDAMTIDGSVSLVDHQLIVRTLHDAHTRAQIYGLDGQLRAEVALPGLGSAGGFGGEADDTETFFAFMNAVTPPTIFRLDMRSATVSLLRAPKTPFDPGAFETEQDFYPGKDGVRIPLTLVHKKGLKRDGSNPTLLYGYGGFGNSITPRFDITRAPWLERGGIFAIANIRGGGEYGEEWHRQGMRSHKQTVFDDFIAAAEWLIAQGYTSTPKLAIEGGSNGGLIVGACLTQRPDLFGAALAYVGVMDMLRFDQFGQGAGWAGDYGLPHNPEDFKALFAYSPYHNVRPQTRYPAALIITGDHDTRVMPAHSFKFAAALQNAQSGPAPVLLRVRLSTGHGSGATTAQLIDEKADAYAFLIENLGM